MKTMRSMAVPWRPVCRAGLGAMEEYRVCVIAADGHIEQRIEFLAPDDQVALELARQHLEGDDAEAWLEHVVAKLKPATP